MIHITLKDYKREAVMLKSLVDELRKTNKELKDENALNRSRLADAKHLQIFNSDLIRDLKLKVSDLQSRNEDLHERLEKEQSDNCELQNLYSSKCKDFDAKCAECKALNEESDALSDSLDNLLQDNSKLEEKLNAYEREGYVVVKEEHYSKLKDVYDKKLAENEIRNANRRKRRAAKSAEKKAAKAKEKKN